MYVLGTRYCDPATGRFINADGALYHSMLGYNMYAYCENNPVNYVDYTGESAVQFFVSWFKYGGTIATVDPTVVGEVVLFVGAVVIATVILIECVEKNVEIKENTIDNVSIPNKAIAIENDKDLEKTISSEIKNKDEVDPNRRSNQKNKAER